MSTRHKTTPGPLSQNRYMSSDEFAELRGVSGVAVSARAAVLLSGVRRNFVWWLQGQSLIEGGFRRVARELVEMFPKRINPEYSQFGVRSANSSGNGSDYHLEDHFHRRAQTLEEFLIDLCINPRLHFSAPGEEVDISEIESDKAMDENPELSKGDFKTAQLSYFKDIIGALFEYKARHEAGVKENFQLTAIGKKIWQTLDYALASRGMVVLDGLEGRGKTEAVKAWCALHLGSARFVSLKGITNKTTAFREIAKALGIASSYTRTAPEMQARIEDVLKRSKLLLVIDEAHFVFNQSRRMYTRPELVDWIDTAICNQGIGIALVTTPQFMVCMTRAADQVEWNYRQFRRRVKRWEKLPDWNTESDIRAVAKNVFKNADGKMIDLIVGYVLLSKLDLSAIGDVASEVGVMLGSADLSKATARQIHQAIHEYLLSRDETIVKDMATVRGMVKKPLRKRVPALAMPEPIDPPDEAPADRVRTSAFPDMSPARGIAPVTVAGSRRSIGSEAGLVPA